MVDLHIHSSHSDGIFDLKEIIEIAQKSNITYFSVTDHDNIESSKEIKDILPCGMFYVSGVELSTVSYLYGEKIKVHILGYGYNSENNELNNVISQMYFQRANDNYEYVIKLLERFSFLSTSMFENFDYGKYGWIKKLILNQVSSNLTIENLNKLKEFLNHEKPIYHNYNFKIEEAIQYIKNAGGYPIIAHPFKLDFDETHIKKFIKYLVDCGLSGIEIYHNEMPLEKIALYKYIAQNNSLFESGGSDFHSYVYDSGLGTINTEFNELSPFIKKLCKEQKFIEGDKNGNK